MKNPPEMDDQSRMTALYEENLEYFNELISTQKAANIIALAGEIAHKMNNLIGVVIGYASMLEVDVSDNESAHKYTQMLMEASDQIASLTKNFLGYARAGRGNLSVVNLNELLERMVRLYRDRYKPKITIKMQTTEDALDVYGNENMLLLAFANIFIKAQTAIPDDGVITITASEGKLPESYHFGKPNSKNLDYAVISISDNGPGMGEDVLKRISDPVFTIKQALSDEVGLSATCYIIQRYEGAISVDTGRGDGSKFHLYLPLVRGDQYGN